jgi:16S rRNA (cytosine967-C5)-methyltransferase
LWVTRPGDIAALAEVQARLLEVAARAVRPGGRLVYSVCSLEPEEGEQQIAEFLLGHPEFVRVPIETKALALNPEAVAAVGEVRLTPIADESPPGGQDGFFAASLLRQASVPGTP